MKHLEHIKSKLYTEQGLKPLIHLIAVWKFKQEKIVFTNGCFDILHLGHVDYLSRAADLGKKLVVGINSDSSVKMLNKGQGRPIQDQTSRATIMAALHFVDAVVVFDQPTPYELIKALEPDVLVKGGDWKVEEIVGSDIVVNKGGVVQTIDFLPGYSTTLIEKKIKNS